MEAENTPRILVADDHSAFKTIRGNRVISKAKVLRLVADYQNGINLFPYCPIIVYRGKEQLHIIDGQHRFEACKKLNLPVFYVQAENIELKDIARMNSNTDKWRNSDFINCFIELGNNDYKILRDWCKEWKVSLSVAVSLLQHNKVSGGGSVISNFKEGAFKVNYLTAATTFIGIVDRLFGRYTFYRDRQLLKAVHGIWTQGLWDVDVMAQKLKENQKLVDKQSAARTYIYLLEHIYNIGNVAHETIYVDEPANN